MATLKDIKRKISAVKQTQKITRAMNMVAAAKLRQVQGRMENFRPYAGKFAELMGNLASRIEGDIHPFLVQPEKVKKVELIAFSSDRGLCGSFNANTISAANRFLSARGADEIEVSLTLVGRKLRDFFRRRPVNIRKAYDKMMSSFDYADSAGIARDAMDLFLEGEVDEVYVLSTRFEGMGRQIPTLVRLLPFAPTQTDDSEPEPNATDYLCEPSIDGIMVELLPKSVSIQVYDAMLQTSTSEQAARMSAMDNATKNCKEMITDLTLVYNKARQAAVTAELLDIVGGAEALKQSG